MKQLNDSIQQESEAHVSMIAFAGVYHLKMSHHARGVLFLQHFSFGVTLLFLLRQTSYE
jgi:hypothetical protein